MSVRVDSWVWAVRLAPSRSRATAACKAGHVRINGARAKPAAVVKVGDEVRIYSAQDKREHIVAVRQLLAKRVGAAVAVSAYDDLTPALPTKQDRPAPVFFREPGSGRPTKADRRALDKLRGRIHPPGPGD